MLSASFGIASNAHSVLSAWNVVSILGGECVAMFAMGFTSVASWHRIANHHIFDATKQTKVRRIYAQMISANVIYS
jgi:hypothetical protein